MNTGVAQRTTRGVSPILFILAALCFLLPFVGVSCNTAAAQSALGPALQTLGGGTGTQAAQARQCIQSLSNRDLATYTGIDLAFGGTPKANTGNLPGCDAGGSATTPVTDQGSIGVQPVLLIALILVVVGALSTALRAPLRNLVAATAAVGALGLVVVNNLSVHAPIIDRLTSSGGGSLSQIGISGSLGGYFDIHAAIGFTLIVIALAAALLVNVAGVVPALRGRVGPPPSGTGPPPTEITWPPAPGPVPPPSPPPA